MEMISKRFKLFKILFVLDCYLRKICGLALKKLYNVQKKVYRVLLELNDLGSAGSTERGHSPLKI